MILCGDIGGTKALMGLAEGARIAGRRRFDCADYDSFDALLSDYLSGAGIRKADIGGGCLAVAGPVEDNGRRARLTNLPWVVDLDALGLPRVKLANDFAAAAMGTTAAASEHLITLRPGEPLAQAPRLVVGAGTGLGMAVLVLWERACARLLLQSAAGAGNGAGAVLPQAKKRPRNAVARGLPHKRPPRKIESQEDRSRRSRMPSNSSVLL